ncbi:hypothetical protein I4U23_016620 [Adineta vaga]|nr:hypothetical protein I4U23_016620 [Adineta vaga]
MESSAKSSSNYQKLALIIGNGNYRRPNNQLSQSIINAIELSTILKRIDFKITLYIDVRTTEEVFENVKRFAENIKDGDLVLFYYSGHANQVNNQNYLIPIYDDRIYTDTDVQDIGCNFDRIFDRLVEKPSSHITVCILDCCRPYWRIGTLESRGVYGGRGLHEIQPIDGTLIQLSCAANKTSRDDLFSKKLLKHIAKENIDIRDLFQLITNDVLTQSNQTQEPLTINGIRQHEPVYFNKVMINTNSSIMIPNIAHNAKWKSTALTIVGGNDHDSTTNKLHCPQGLCVSRDNQTIFIADNTNGLKKIDKFELNENQHSTIHWWSQDSFIYRSINSALHSHHWNSIIKYRYFIVKLHNELKILHQEQYPIVYKDDDKEEEDLHNKFLVYRGQGIFPHDLDLLKNNIGGLVCINSFLSTTSDEELAIAFAQKCEEKATVAVIFQIMLDRRVLSAIFADISTYSNMKNEPEILLSMGCVFRVENVMYDKISDRWSVNIYLTDPNEDSLFSYMLKEFEDKNLGQVLYQMEEYEAARDYCQLMLRYTNDHLIHYSTLGNVLKEMGEYDQALENHYNALKLVKSIYECTEIFYNIGVTYLGKHNSYRALQYYHEASELECVEGETMKLAEIYHDMGLAYINIGALRLGVNYLEKALNIQKNILPSNHYHLGYTYLNLGDYYRNRNEIKQAMEYYQNALEIFRCSRRQDKELVIKTHIRIGQLYINMEQYDMTRKTFEQLAHIYGKTINGLALANIYMYIVVYIFFPKYNFLQCISYIEYVLSIRKQNLPTNHILIGITFYNLGSFQLIFHRQSSSKTDLTILEASRSNLMHAIDILTSHSSYLPKAIENLAHVYYTLKEYDQSIECFKKSINYSSTNDHLLPQRYQNLSCVYEKMCKFKNAIKSLKYALHLYNSSSIGIANTNIIRSHTLLGTYFKFTKNYNAALKHLFIALSLWRMKALPLDTDCVVSAIYYHIADIYYKLNFHRQSFIAQLFHIEYDLRVKQLKSQEETEITSVDPYPGYVNGFVICIVFNTKLVYTYQIMQVKIVIAIFALLLFMASFTMANRYADDLSMSDDSFEAKRRDVLNFLRQRKLEAEKREDWRHGGPYPGRK